MHIAKSETRENTWFIFREKGVEVEVIIKRQMLKPSHKLNPEEVEYFRANILRKITYKPEQEIQRSSIIKLL